MKLIKSFLTLGLLGLTHCTSMKNTEGNRRPSNVEPTAQNLATGEYWGEGFHAYSCDWGYDISKEEYRIRFSVLIQNRGTDYCGNQGGTCFTFGPGRQMAATYSSANATYSAADNSASIVFLKLNENQKVNWRGVDTILKRAGEPDERIICKPVFYAAGE